MAVQRLHPTAEPNVIPFIDVLLVLLIIFMVTAPTPTVDLHVDLPRGATLQGPMRATLVIVQAEASGYSVWVDEESVAIAQLGDRALAHAARNNPGLPAEVLFSDARLLVRADQSTAYGDVVDVMNRLREARFAKVGIFVETAEET